MSHKKKIYFIIGKMTGGGAERVVAILLKNINREEFTPKLILLNKVGEYLKDIPKHVDIIDLKKRSPLDFFRLLFVLRRIVKDEQPDILFSHLYYNNILTVLSSLLLSIKHKPQIIVCEHNSHRGYLPHARLGWLKTLLIQFTYRRADKVISVSKGIYDALVQDFKIDKEKLTIIYNPFDIKQIQKLSQNDVSLQYFEEHKDYYIIISIGRLERQKNYKFLLESFSLIKDENIRLVILGQGSLRDELMKIVQEKGIEKKVDFIGFQENPFSWIAKADLFVLSSDWEGFGNVIVEAMCCGTPVISTDCPSGPNEIITHNQNGFLVPMNDKSALIRAILRMKEKPEMRESFCDQAFETIKQFDMNKIVRKYEKTFEEILHL